jgi:hypothetical protein
VKTSFRFFRPLLSAFISVQLMALYMTNANAQIYRPTVYIVAVTQNTASPLNGDLRDFTTTLLKLRLNELNSFKVEDATTPPKCSESPKANIKASDQKSLASEADFYTINSSIEVRTSEKSETEIALTYELSKCVGGEFVPIKRSTEPFGETETLTYIKSMADVVALLLEKEKTVTNATVTVSTEGSVNAQAKKIALGLTNEIETNIKHATDFTLTGETNLPNFRIRGDISILNKVLYRVAILTKDGKSYATKTIVGPEANALTDEALAAFYKTAASDALDYLKHVRYVAEPRRGTSLTDQEYAQLLETARKQMCVGVTTPPDCKQQPELAVLSLTEVRDRKRRTDYELLGRAQMLVGDYTDAAASFDSARIQVQDLSPKQSLALLTQSADASFKAKNYKAAIVRYDQALFLFDLNRANFPSELPEEEARIQLQKIRSLRYDERAEEGLRILFDNWHDSNETREELRYLISDVSDHKLGEVDKIIRAHPENPAYHLASRILVDRLARRNLSELIYNFTGAVDAVEKTTSDVIDRILSEVDAIPSGTLAPETILLQRTLRALWFRDYKNDYKSALLLLEPAARENLDPRSSKDSAKVRELTRVGLIETYYRFAQLPENRNDSAAYYERALGLVKDWTRENPYFYFWLEEIGHQLERDEYTKKLLQERIRDNNQDYEAILSLARVQLFKLYDLNGASKTLDSIPSEFAKFSFTYSQIKAQLQLFKGEYEDSQKVFDLAEFYDIPRALGLFYNTWALLKLQQQQKAYASAREWREEMNKFRPPDVRSDFRSVIGVAGKGMLDAAGRALGIETLPPRQKKLLLAMYYAMDDKSRPLPAIPN